MTRLKILMKFKIFTKNLNAFIQSIKRWAHLKFVSSVAISLKRLCTIRWMVFTKSRNDCLKALSLLYVDILKLLTYI
jgi:hypothetical protein